VQELPQPSFLSLLEQPCQFQELLVKENQMLELRYHQQPTVGSNRDELGQHPERSVRLKKVGLLQ
jgi:hypothetical protein